jgi:hypothetical protein
VAAQSRNVRRHVTGPSRHKFLMMNIHHGDGSFGGETGDGPPDITVHHQVAHNENGQPGERPNAGRKIDHAAGVSSRARVR